MGGFGSGRQLDAKAVTSSYLCIDVAHLKKQGALMPGCEFVLRFSPCNSAVAGESEESVVWFTYSIRQGNDDKDYAYRVPLSFSQGQFAGQRA